MKHLEMNSFSDWRALPDSTFFIIFLRVRVFFPPVLNLRMFSLLRLIFSFLALTRQASREVRTPKRAGRGANAWKRKIETIDL